MDRDAEIKKDIEARLSREPGLDAADIGVSVKRQVVTLTGFVRSYAEFCRAERAAERASGVRGLANDIEVRLPLQDVRTDPEIARDAVAALERDLSSAAELIKVVVKDGYLRLQGEVTCRFHKDEASRAVRGIKGVRGVSNAIHVKPRVQPLALKKKIEAAFIRQAQFDARHVRVECDGGLVTLKGHVHSWAERQEAERQAWAEPGTVAVRNELTIDPWPSAASQAA
jgi:osmotically-inducible protein OsmY